MNVLVVGGGGREHALAWRLAQSQRVARVYVAPGNAGTATEEGCYNVDVSGNEALLDFARREAISLTVVGPEAPLSGGLVDTFRAAGQRIFGPTRHCARLESSKEYAKDFMLRHAIPTAHHRSFSDADQADAYLRERGAPIVIKADGLAAGKGVVVAMTLDEAHDAVDRMLRQGGLGTAGARVVIEEFLEGEEASFIVLVDGRNVLALASSQDHKRLLDGDRGPNTGGMGAYSPAPVLTPALHARAMREVIAPAVAGMAAEGEPYTGFLYAGLMIQPDGQMKVLEFNCRLGDPETQPILLRLKSDLFTLLQHGVAGTLDRAEALWDRRVALGVVMAAEGYPDSPVRGARIHGIPVPAEDLHVFHAGTVQEGDAVLVQGGRVLCVTALGDTARLAQRRAYAAAQQIEFAGRQMRSDIGHRAVSARRIPL